MPDGLRPTFLASQHKPELEFCYSTVQSQKNPSSSCKPLTVPKKLSKILRFWTVFIGLNNFYNLYIDLFQERKSSKHQKKFHFRISQNIHLYVQDKKKKVDASCFFTSHPIGTAALLRKTLLRNTWFTWLKFSLTTQEVKLSPGSQILQSWIQVRLSIASRELVTFVHLELFVLNYLRLG